MGDREKKNKTPKTENPPPPPSSQPIPKKMNK